MLLTRLHCKSKLYLLQLEGLNIKFLLLLFISAGALGVNAPALYIDSTGFPSEYTLGDTLLTDSISVTSTLLATSLVVTNTSAFKGDLTASAGASFTGSKGISVTNKVTTNSLDVSTTTRLLGSTLVSAGSGTPLSINAKAGFPVTITRPGVSAMQFRQSNSSEGAFTTLEDTAGSGSQQITLVNTGNVGIGTGAPGAKLSVSGRISSSSGLITSGPVSITSDANLTISGSISAANGIYMDDYGSGYSAIWVHALPPSSSNYFAASNGSAATVINAPTSQDLCFTIANGNCNQTFDSGGNVGIGTALTNPVSKLEVAGTISGSGITTSGIISASKIGIGDGAFGAPSIYLQSDPTIGIAGFNTNALDFVVGGSTFMSLDYNIFNDVVINPNGELIFFRVASQSNDYSLYVEPTSGNVGIGTISPTASLYVSGSMKVSTTSTGVNALASAAIDGVGIVSTSQSSIAGFFTSRTSTGLFVLSDDGDIVSFGNGQFFVDNTEKFVINNDGKVGIRLNGGDPTISVDISGSYRAVPPSTFTLTADNMTLPGSRNSSMMFFDSDDASAANRTFLLETGLASGQLLTICLVSNQAQLTDDSALTSTGNVRLASTFNMTADDCLSLVFDGTDWVEKGRSVN